MVAHVFLRRFQTLEIVCDLQRFAPQEIFCLQILAANSGWTSMKGSTVGGYRYAEWKPVVAFKKMSISSQSCHVDVDVGGL